MSPPNSRREPGCLVDYAGTPCLSIFKPFKDWDQLLIRKSRSIFCIIQPESATVLILRTTVCRFPPEDGSFAAQRTDSLGGFGACSLFAFLPTVFLGSSLCFFLGCRLALVFNGNTFPRLVGEDVDDNLIDHLLQLFQKSTGFVSPFFYLPQLLLP